MKTAILSLTGGGRTLAETLASSLSEAIVVTDGRPVAEVLAENWHSYDAFVCIMAAGIVVRAIAPLVEDKMSDPSIVVVDEKGCFAVSLLSGHLGGGNDLARQVAGALGGQPVITTASDTLGLCALDLWARDNGLVVEDRKALTRASAKLVNQGVVRIYIDGKTDSLPPEFISVEDVGLADIIVTSKQVSAGGGTVFMRPANLVVGIGCNRDTGADEIDRAITELFKEYGLSPLSIRNLASIDLKKDEAGLLKYGKQKNLPLEFFSKEQLNEVPGISRSDVVLAATGAVGVAEPASLLSASMGKLIIRKRKWTNVTLAVTEIPYTLSAQARAGLTT